MGLAYTKESAYAQERRKHESQHTDFGPPGRPYTFQEYPKRLYKAIRPDTGGQVTFDGRDAGNSTEERNLLSRGYRCGQDKALELLDKTAFAVAEAAANRAYQEQRMSAKARAEAEAADNATAAHLPEIPEKPRRGRKPNKPAEVPHGV